MKIEYQQTAWLTSPDLLAGLDLSNSKSVARAVTIIDTSAGMESYGWIRIGSADVVINIDTSQTEINSCAVEQIDNKINEMRAEHQLKLTALTELKQSLLALEG